MPPRTTTRPVTHCRRRSADGESRWSRGTWSHSARRSQSCTSATLRAGTAAAEATPSHVWGLPSQHQPSFGARSLIQSAGTRRSWRREPDSMKHWFFTSSSGACVTSAMPSSIVSGVRSRPRMTGSASSGRTPQNSSPRSTSSSRYAGAVGDRRARAGGGTSRGRPRRGCGPRRRACVRRRAAAAVRGAPAGSGRGSRRAPTAPGPQRHRPGRVARRHPLLERRQPEPEVALGQTRQPGVPERDEVGRPGW